MTTVWTDTRIRTDGVVVVTVRGEVDFLNVDAFRAAVSVALLDCPLGVELDLALVTFIDSMGIAELVHADRAARAAGTLLMLRPSPVVSHVLRIAGLAAVFDLASPTA
jgi:anti-anti-sigma factor